MLTSPLSGGVLPSPKTVFQTTQFAKDQSDIEGELLRLPGMTDLGDLELIMKLNFCRLRCDLLSGEVGRYLALNVACLEFGLIGLDHPLDAGTTEKREDRHPHF